MRILFLGLALLCAPLFAQGEIKQAPARPETGKPAPAFRLNDHEGRAVQVGGRAETWTVLAFYPKAATGG